MAGVISAPEPRTLPSRDWVGTLNLEILKNTSPEAAIKFAYDFARGLRLKEADAGTLNELLQRWVTIPFQDNPLQRYIKGGFIAGYTLGPLPWKQQIDEEQSPISNR